MKVQAFPLAWRWTDSRYSVLPETVLSQLQPMELHDARRAFQRAQEFRSHIRHSRVSHSADVPDEKGRAWLRQQHTRDGAFITALRSMSFCPAWLSSGRQAPARLC